MPNVLFIFTSTDKNLLGVQTGYYLSEAAHPYYILAPHASIDFASPKGPNPPLDESSIKAAGEDELCIKYLNDDEVKSKLASALPLSEVDTSKYDAIFYPGGHGPMFDLPDDPTNIAIATKAYNAGKIIAAVCHGPAAITNVRDSNGKPILSGKNCTSFSNTEEEMLKATNAVPFSLEDRIVERGGIYSKSDQPWGAKVVVDGNILTGQNPSSAGPLGEEILKLLLK